MGQLVEVRVLSTAPMTFRPRRSRCGAANSQGGERPAEGQNAKRDTQLAAANLFETVARKFVEDREDHKWTPEYAASMLRRLELNVFPHIGERPIADITPSEALAVLQRIEARGCHELAHRMQQACKQIFTYRRVRGVHLQPSRRSTRRTCSPREAAPRRN